jgi:uncharacterized membrane protein
VVSVTRIVYLLALIVWLGEVLFLSFVVAPAMFRTFEVEIAGRAVGALFPIYYKIGYACGTALVGASATLWFVTGRGVWSVAGVLATIMLAATLYAGLVVHPQAQGLRPQLHQAGTPPSLKVEFDRLHRLAVQLNGIVLAGGLVVAVISAFQLKR